MTQSKHIGQATAPQADEAGCADAALQALGGAPSVADEAYPIEIRSDGTWTYHGSPIGRLALVKLFSTVLRRDAEGDYWLITPAERGRIKVADAPFIAVALAVEGVGEGQTLTFTTNLEAEVTAGPDHPIRVVTDPVTGEPRPYIRVKGPPLSALEARINRAIFYDLVERAVSGPDDEIGVWSGGMFFALGRVDGG